MKRVSALLLTCTLGLSALSGCSASAAPQNDLSAVLSGHIGDDLAGLCILDHGSLRHL